VIIAFSNQKGGTGKTLLSLHLAHAQARRNRKTLLIDADPQGSARDWLTARDQGDPLQFVLLGLDRPTLHRDIASLRADYNDVIIDSPPRVSDIARSAILAADLVVIPVQPSPFDLWASAETVRLIKESSVYKGNSKSVYAINREIVNTAIGRDISETLTQSEYPVLHSHVCQRVAFAECLAQGKTVYETNSDIKAVAEIDALADEILCLMGEGR
jgi:chromosome partitioning protein